jgi:hypothetical protein
MNDCRDREGAAGRESQADQQSARTSSVVHGQSSWCAAALQESTQEIGTSRAAAGVARILARLTSAVTRADTIRAQPRAPVALCNGERKSPLVGAAPNLELYRLVRLEVRSR